MRANFCYYSRRFEFFAFRAGHGPTATIRLEDVSPCGITIVVGWGVRQRFTVVVGPLGVAGHVSLLLRFVEEALSVVVLYDAHAPPCLIKPVPVIHNYYPRFRSLELLSCVTLICISHSYFPYPSTYLVVIITCTCELLPHCSTLLHNWWNSSNLPTEYIFRQESSCTLRSLHSEGRTCKYKYEIVCRGRSL